MKENEFSHPQGSGYISNDVLSNSEIFLLSQKLLRQYPYLSKCIRDIRTADILEVNFINHYFDYDGTPGKYVAKPMKHSKAGISKDNAERGINDRVKSQDSNSESKKSLLSRLEHTKAQAQKIKRLCWIARNTKKIMD